MSSLAKVVAVLAVLALAPAARAQSDEWSGFKPPPPPPTQPTQPTQPVQPTQPQPAVQPKPAAQPAPAAPPAAQPVKTQPAPQPAKPEAAPAGKQGYVPPPTVPVAAPGAPAAEKGKDAPALVDTKVAESVVPGTEPHSPSTYGNSLTSLSNLRITSGATGATGLLRLGSADLGPAGVVRISVTGEYFTLNDFPVLKANDTRTNGTLAIDWTFLKWGEVYFSYGATANTNTKSSPPLMQAQGDIHLGLKGAIEAVKGLRIGADLALVTYPGVGSQDFGRYAVGFEPKLLVTFDAQKHSPKVPLRMHLNFGGALDNTGALIDPAVHRTTPAEEFALGINKYQRLTFGAGVDLPLPWVTPFVEYRFALPLVGSDTLVGPDLRAVSVGDSMAQQLGVGLKVTAIRDLTILLACEIGLSRYVALGVPATAPYNVVVGLSYAFDPLAKGTSKVVEKTLTYEKKVEVATAAPIYTGKVSGQVLDAETHQPIAGVVVAASGADLPPVATDLEAGKFLTHELPAGKMALTFSRDGYKPAAADAVVEAAKVTPLAVTLVRDVKPTTVLVKLVSGRTKAGGKLSFAGPKTAEMTVAAEGGTIELPKGHYTATVEAEGYLSKNQEFDVPEGGTLNLSIELALKPKQGLVVIKEDRIQIKQQVHFATGKAEILSDSFQLLDQVVDAILRTNVKKLRIEGHTDNQGGKDANLKLSQARAQAVLDYLIKKGLPAARLTSEGYGDSKPVAPNLTAKGRELNRRVEFMIVER